LTIGNKQNIKKISIMKKHLLIIPALFFSFVVFSQGIEFEQGTWKEVLAKAEQTHKPIFVDVYTAWCGPCKMMSKQTFPLEQVGKVYNANFVCYQVDAEKGEGIEIAGKYNVEAYPTYLFIKANGTLFSKASGFMNAEDFIEVSKSALAEMNDLKPMEEWDKEYLQKKNDPKFILDYMNKRSKFGLSNASLFDEYLKLIPEEERTSSVVVKMYMKELLNIKVNSFAFENLQKNKIKFPATLPVDSYLEIWVLNTVHEAAYSKNEKLLVTALSIYDQVKTPTSKCKDEIYMEYYQITGETGKYVKYASSFCNNELMKLSPDSIFNKDKMMVKLYEQQQQWMTPDVIAQVIGLLDSFQIRTDSAFLMEQMNQMPITMAHAERDKISKSLNEIAWQIFEKVSDKKVLKDALTWSKRSLELIPDNPAYLDTYANLLYKLGRKKEAIAKEKEALDYSKKGNTDESKGYEETLRKMNAGEKTWK
jgi:thioredoxin-related protein